MSNKRIIGLVALVIGIVLIIFSVHSMNRISGAKSEIHDMTQPFSGNSAGKKVGNVMEGKASQYDMPVMVLLISGIILAVVGGSVVIFSKKKKRR